MPKRLPVSAWIKKVNKRLAEDHERFSIVELVGLDEHDKPLWEDCDPNRPEENVPGTYGLLDAESGEIETDCVIVSDQEKGARRVRSIDPAIMNARNMNAISDGWEGFSRFMREDLNQTRQELKEAREKIERLEDENRELKTGEFPYEKILERLPMILQLLVGDKKQTAMINVLKQLAPRLSAEAKQELAGAINATLAEEADGGTTNGIAS